MIMGNTLTLAMDHPFMSAEMERVLEVFNSVFTVVFIVELLVKVSER